MREVKIGDFVETRGKARDEMLLKCSVDELRKFIQDNRGHYSPKFVKDITLASDEVLVITLHKMIVNCTSLPVDFRQKSVDWLKNRNFDLEV